MAQAERERNQKHYLKMTGKGTLSIVPPIEKLLPGINIANAEMAPVANELLNFWRSNASKIILNRKPLSSLITFTAAITPDVLIELITQELFEGPMESSTLPAPLPLSILFHLQPGGLLTCCSDQISRIMSSRISGETTTAQPWDFKLNLAAINQGLVIQESVTLLPTVPGQKPTSLMHTSTLTVAGPAITVQSVDFKSANLTADIAEHFKVIEHAEPQSNVVKFLTAVGSFIGVSASKPASSEADIGPIDLPNLLKHLDKWNNKAQGHSKAQAEQSESIVHQTIYTLLSEATAQMAEINDLCKPEKYELNISESKRLVECLTKVKTTGKASLKQITDALEQKTVALQQVNATFNSLPISFLRSLESNHGFKRAYISLSKTLTSEINELKAFKKEIEKTNPQLEQAKKIYKAGKATLIDALPTHQVFLDSIEALHTDCKIKYHSKTGCILATQKSYEFSAALTKSLELVGRATAEQLLILDRRSTATDEDTISSVATTASQLLEQLKQIKTTYPVISFGEDDLLAFTEAKELLEETLSQLAKKQLEYKHSTQVINETLKPFADQLSEFAESAYEEMKIPKLPSKKMTAFKRMAKELKQQYFEERKEQVTKLLRGYTYSGWSTILGVKVLAKKYLPGSNQNYSEENDLLKGLVKKATTLDKIQTLLQAQYDIVVANRNEKKTIEERKEIGDFEKQLKKALDLFKGDKRPTVVLQSTTTTDAEATGHRVCL